MDFQSICDVSIFDQYASISDYFLDKEQSFDLDVVCKDVETQLITQLSYVAWLQYAWMLRSGDWGDAGEMQVKASFMRWVLSIDPSSDISYSSYDVFEKEVVRQLAVFCFNDLSEAVMKDTIETYRVSVWGFSSVLHDLSLFNKLTKFVGSSLFVQSGMYGYAKEFILGEGAFSTFDDYSVVTFSKETVRSPYTIIPMAAVIGDKEIFVRRESMATVFSMKWGCGLGHFYGGRDVDVVSYGLRKRTLSLYGERSDFRAVFIDDLTETVLFHELGHGVTQHRLLPMEVACVGEATKVFGENIFTGLLEFMADFAPVDGKLKGPIQNMIAISKYDYLRGHRMFMSYFSDTWFLDTPDAYMYLYTDLVSIIFAQALKDDGTVDFDWLDGFCFSTIIPFVLDTIGKGAESLISFVKGHSFLIDGDKMAYDEAFIVLKAKVLSESVDTMESDSYAYHAALWAYLLDASKSVSVNLDYFERYLKKKETAVLADLLYLVTGKKGDSRQYVLDRLQSVL